MKVTQEAHQDKTADDPRWVSVTFEPVESFKKPVSLQQIKAVEELKNIELIKQSRLAVMKLNKHQFEIIIALSD